MAFVSRGLLFLAVVSAAACMTTRSISDAGFGYYGHGDLYRGELSDLDVLGIDPAAAITEKEITEAFARDTRPRIPSGSAVLLVQSGALFPDDALQRALGRHYRVGPLSGIPSQPPDTPALSKNLSKALRLAAAQGGYGYVIVCWGVLEAKREDLATKGVSWVPVIGRAIPDETQDMRLRLRAVVVDARSGQWGMVSPAPVEGEKISARQNRPEADQEQVERLKERGYEQLVEQLIKEFGG